MACCFCGSDSHDTKGCPWYKSGKRILAVGVVALALAGCVQKQPAIEPRYPGRAQDAYVHDVLVQCSAAVATTVDTLWKQGVEITQADMQWAYSRCLRELGVTI